MNHWDEQYDVVIVGSGAAGLTSAITAARRGLKPLVIEKAAVWGGTTAWSGGGVWAPANALQKAAGISDSTEEAARFLDEVVTNEGLATSPQRRIAFLRAAPHMVDMLIGEGLQWTCDEKHPDYLSDRRHAGIGRDLDSKFFDAKKLGVWRESMRRGPEPYAIRLQDIPLLGQGVSSFKSLSRMAYVYLRHKILTMMGQDPVGCGASLAAQLMLIAQKHRVEIRLETPLKDLVLANGRVTGIIAGAENRRIGARKGVMLAAGGFAHSAFRERLQGVDGRWSSASPDDSGDVVGMAEKIDAMTAMLDEAWWGSSFVYPGDVPVFCQWERSLPFSIVVDAEGRRFTDEAEDYYSFGKAMIAHGIKECWLIMDARHRRRYTFGGFFPGITPRAMFDRGFFKRAGSLNGIAAACGINAAQLAATVQRFNGFVDEGIDQDFARGGEPYDRFWGDPNHRPNPNLGRVEQGPFLATRIVLGDLGTKGGLVTDEHAQVLNLCGHPISGLYAAGNSTASVMGRTYPGPGVTLGPAMSFAFIAMQHAADSVSLPAGAASEWPALHAVG